MKRYILLLLAVGWVVILAVQAAAEQNIQLKSGVYTPKVSAKVADLKGKKVSLVGFDNNAQDTGRSGYYNKAREITYKTPDEWLADYLWYSMRKYLWAAGMKVFQAPAPVPSWTATPASQIPPDTPAFGLNFTSWTDTVFLGEVTMTKPGEPPVQKNFAIAFDPPGAMNPESLETRAYENLDKIFETIFTDPVIRGVLSK